MSHAMLYVADRVWKCFHGYAKGHAGQAVQGSVRLHGLVHTQVFFFEIFTLMETR